MDWIKINQHYIAKSAITSVTVKLIAREVREDGHASNYYSTLYMYQTGGFVDFDIRVIVKTVELDGGENYGSDTREYHIDGNGACYLLEDLGIPVEEAKEEVDNVMRTINKERP